MDNNGDIHPLFPKPLHISKVIAPLRYKRAIVRSVEELGEVEPILVDPRTGIDQIQVEERRNKLEALKTKLQSYISVLDEAQFQIDGKISVGSSEEGVINFIDEIISEKGNRIEEIVEQRESIEARITELESIKSLIERFHDLSINSSSLGDTRLTRTILASISPMQINNLLWGVDQVTEGKYFYLEEGNILPKQETATVLLSVLQKDAEVVLDKIKGLSAQEIVVPKDVDLEGLDINDCDLEQSFIEKKAEKLEEELISISEESGFTINAALEVCQIELSRIAIELKMKRTESTCVMWSWIPEHLKERFKTSISTATDGTAVFDFKKGDFDPATVPSYVTNSKFMKPMRGVVNAFGVAGLHEVDPYPFVKFLLPIFFGIMFADVGHGFLFLMFGLYAKRKKDAMLKPPEGLSAFIFGGPELIIVMGATAMFMGFPMNSLFGDETILWQSSFLRFLFENTTWKFFFILNHGAIERNYLNFLIFSFAVGAVVILLGLSLNVYQLRLYMHSKSQFYAAVSLLSGYLFFVLGAIFFVFSSTVGMIFIIGGLLSLLATAVIEYRAHKIDGLMMAIDHILSLMSNTFSFGRLLAMNTVHFVLAFLPYLFIDMWWKDGVLNHYVDQWVPRELWGYWFLSAMIGAAIVVPVEGVFSTLQALRLNWVEFYGKFFKATGVPFVPVETLRIYTQEKLN